MEGGRVLWVAGDIKFASVCGNEGISSHEPLRRETEVKLAEDMAESFREEFCPLLDESGNRGDFIGQEIEIFEQFMADAAAPHAEEETDQLYKPYLPVTGEIFFWVFGKLGSVAGYGIHDCLERRFDLLRE